MSCVRNNSSAADSPESSSFVTRSVTLSLVLVAIMGSFWVIADWVLSAVIEVVSPVWESCRYETASVMQVDVNDAIGRRASYLVRVDGVAHTRLQVPPIEWKQ